MTYRVNVIPHTETAVSYISCIIDIYIFQFINYTNYVI